MDRQADGRMDLEIDIKKLIVSFLSFRNAPINSTNTSCTVKILKQGQELRCKRQARYCPCVLIDLHYDSCAFRPISSPAKYISRPSDASKD